MDAPLRRLVLAEVEMPAMQRPEVEEGLEAGGHVDEAGDELRRGLHVELSGQLVAVEEAERFERPVAREHAVEERVPCPPRSRRALG